MKIRNKNYPHPVLTDWGDDIKDSIISCDIDFRWDKTYYYLNYSLKIKNRTIEEAIASGKSHFMLHVECSKTFFREAFKIELSDVDTDVITGTINIPANKIKDVTEVSIFVCASSPIENYLPENMHSDYGSMSFQLGNGDFMAAWKTCRFTLYQEYDPIKKADSIISFHRDMERQTGEIEVDTGYDKLIARLPIDIHDMYEGLKADKNKEDIIVTMLALPVIIEGLQHIKSEEERSENDGQGLRWYRSILNKLHGMGIERIQNEDSMFKLAQKILELPYNRSAFTLTQLDEN